jgi:hypothetical protein
MGLSYNPILLARSEILLLMLFEWILLYLYGPFLLKEPLGRTKLIIRACAGLTALGILGLQGHIYIANFAPENHANGKFITTIFVLQNVVGLLLVFRAAFKARHTESDKLPSV